MYILLFWIILAGISLAMIQDLKRREVDNWLNFSLLLFGMIFIIFESIFESEIKLFYSLIFILIVGFISMHLFYNARVFAGGDAKLLFALSPFFASVTIFSTFLNFIIFVCFLFLSGGVYGLLYSFVLYIKNFNSSNKKIKAHLIKYKFWWFVLFGIILIVLSYFNSYILVFGIITLIFPFLFSFAKGLEEVVMVKEIDTNKLRPGDWLHIDVKVGKNIIKSNFDGLTVEEIKLLQNKKKVFIRDGIPFVPSFFIAFILNYFFLDFILSLFSRIVI